MNKPIKIILIFFLFGILFALAFNFFTQAYTENKLLKQTSNKLTEDAKNKTDQINLYLSQINENIISLQNSAQVKELFGKNPITNNLIQNSDYSNILLISTEGYIIYTSNSTEYFGTNLESENNSEKGLSKNYFKVKASKEISFYGPYVESYGEVYPDFSVMAPVYDGDILLGYVCITDKMNNLFKITERVKNLGETGQSYLVNSKGILISPLRDKGLDILSQSINTKNSENCINDIGNLKNNNYYFESPKGFSNYENYRGDEVFGVYSYIPNLNWCMLNEINKDEINFYLQDSALKNLYFSLAGIFIFLIISFFIQKTSFSIKKILFFQTTFVIAILSTFSIYFLKNLNEINILEFIPEFLSLIVFIFLFFYVMSKKEGTARTYLFFGVLISIFAQTMRLILEGKFLEMNLFIWMIPIIILSIIGIFLILLGFREVVK